MKENKLENENKTGAELQTNFIKQIIDKDISNNKNFINPPARFVVVNNFN